MKQIILGTAGHIDHGKTALIKAITGVNTDRLKEEQIRGITIELGFAPLDLPSGQHLGIVDVPGHEKFVKNMVAGATGIDLVVMVIAADEGVMPQTREHMEICSLLGIQNGLVVLTKTDLVDEDWLELVLDDVQEFVQDTFLEDAPIIPVSSATGHGIPEFIQALDELSRRVPARSSAGLFRLPVDRVFTMKGFGTVITGTLISGRIQTGKTIMIYPLGITSKVRGIQVHNQPVAEAEAGMRTAINFQGLEKASINRGDVLGGPGELMPSYMLDVTFHLLESHAKAVKNRSRVRFHAGTSEVLGNLILLDRDEVAPGETTVAQLRLDSPLALVRDDRFVIRSYSPVRTIGGGQIINPIPSKHKRFKNDVIEQFKSLVEKDPEEIISRHALESSHRGLSFTRLRLMTNTPDKQLEQILQGMLSERKLILVDKENRIYIHGQSFDQLKKDTAGHLGNYHKANPLKGGMPKEELKSKLPSELSTKLFNQLISQMIKEKAIVQEEDTVRLSGHAVSLGIDQADLKEKILNTYSTSGLTPPYFKELCKTFGIDPSQGKEVLMLLVGEGTIIKTKEDLYFHAEALNNLKARLVDFLSANGEISTPEFKEMTGASRKFVIPLLEYFDAKNVTIRIGDIRKLRNA